jgi:geranylgeranyl pyrophosphate synthase
VTADGSDRRWDEARRDLDATLAVVEERLRRETDSEDPLMREMARHVVFAGGKRVRPKVAILAHRACGGEGLEGIVDAAAGVELVHAASLVHDDIIDEADLRRGSWSIHRKYGVSEALVAGDYLFTRGFAAVGSLKPEVVETLSRSSTRLAEGEVREMRGGGPDGVTPEEYREVARRKTAAPIEGAARAGALLADAPEAQVDALGRYGREMGLAFQIRDDLLDVEADPSSTGKSTGLDADQGVGALPLVLHREAGGSTPMFPRFQGIEDDLAASGALDEARQTARDHARRARTALEALPESPQRSILDEVALRAVERES